MARLPKEKEKRGREAAAQAAAAGMPPVEAGEQHRTNDERR
jgi:hypothetical protein